MTDEQYDPRKNYSYVPAFLVCLLVSIKCLAYISPYLAGMFLTAENVGLLLSISSDETFNAILSAMIGYWIRDKIAKT